MDNRTIDEVRRNEDRLINKIELLEKENQKLKNNWAKLKKWLKIHINTTTKDTTRVLIKSVLVNVKEIEKSDK